MSDPRNDTHDKKVKQQKKHRGTDKPVVAAPAVAAEEAAVPDEAATPKTEAALEGSLVVLAQLKDLEFHSRAHIQRLAELALTVEDELKQKDLAVLLSDVYSAQNAVQTKLTALIEAYQAECDRRQS